MRATLAELCLAGVVGQPIAGRSNCAVAGTSNLILTESVAELKSEVVRLMNESVAVASSSEWINSSRPVFVWASEAKVACGKA
jgi:hypothetical protein